MTNVFGTICPNTLGKTKRKENNNKKISLYFPQLSPVLRKRKTEALFLFSWQLLCHNRLAILLWADTSLSSRLFPNAAKTERLAEMATQPWWWLRIKFSKCSSYLWSWIPLTGNEVWYMLLRQIKQTNSFKRNKSTFKNSL